MPFLTKAIELEAGMYALKLRADYLEKMGDADGAAKDRAAAAKMEGN